MAERPDPDTDRRNILPGEHAKPDGTWCPYLAPSNEAGVWVCMKCGNSGGVSTPDTDPNTLADRLDDLANDRRWDCWNQHGGGSLDVPEGYDPSPDCCDAADGADALRAAADGLRQYAAITAERDQLRAERTQLTGDSMTDLKMTYAYEAGHEDGKAEVREQLAAITAAIGDRQRIADALTEVADYHVTECVDMHGDQGEDGPGDGCCFHARAAYRVGDAARLLRGAASLSPTPTPKFVCPVCGEWRDREGTCDACIPLVHDMLADAAPTPTPQHCPTCGSDDPALGRSGGKAVRVHACPDAWHDSQG